MTLIAHLCRSIASIAVIAEYLTQHSEVLPSARKNLATGFAGPALRVSVAEVRRVREGMA